MTWSVLTESVESLIMSKHVKNAYLCPIFTEATYFPGVETRDKQT